MAPEYSVRENAISDLGIISETAALFTLTLGAVGALSIIGGYFLFREDGRKGFLLHFLAGVGAIGAGVISLNASVGAPRAVRSHGLPVLQPPTSAAMRDVEGPLRAIAVVTGTLHHLLGGDVRQRCGVDRPFRAYGHGGLERMIAYPPMIWLFAYGSVLMSTSRKTDAEAPPA